MSDPMAEIRASFFVECENEEQLQDRFTKLSDGGKVMMPLAKQSYMPLSVNELEETIHEGADTGRPVQEVAQMLLDRAMENDGPCCGFRLG